MNSKKAKLPLLARRAMTNRLKIFVICSLLFVTTAITYARHKDGAASAQPSADAAPMKCPKCQSPMEDGFLLDQQGYDAQYTDALWIQGPVKKKFVGGIETKVRRPIVADRCTNCGFLELYAK
jgi:predicted nucleic-acid-binding Zn-ribbon protein